MTWYVGLQKITSVKVPATIRVGMIDLALALLDVFKIGDKLKPAADCSGPPDFRV